MTVLHLQSAYTFMFLSVRMKDVGIESKERIKNDHCTGKTTDRYKSNSAS